MIEKPKENEEPEVKVFEIHRNKVSDTDVDDLRILRTQQSHSKDWSEATKEEVLDDLFCDNTNSYVIRNSFVGLKDNRIVTTGQLDLSPGNSVGSIEHIVVHSDMRGKGLGRKIMEHLLVEAKKEGLTKLVLTSNPSRIAAHSLYKSLGFKIVGEKQKYDKGGNPTHKTCKFELDLS